MAKECKKLDCSNPVFGGWYCKFHQYLRTDKKSKGLKFKSDRRMEEDKLYAIKRRKFLEKTPKCWMCYQNEQNEKINKTTEVHHKYRRVGAAYLDESTWIASCRSCNSRCETDPEWAYKNGYLATQEELTLYYKEKGKLI